METKDNRFYRQRGADDCFVWSHEHSAWWASPGGYTKSLTDARVFTREQAMTLCAAAIIGTAAKLKALPDLPVRREDVLRLRGDYLDAFPDRNEAWI